MNHKILFFSVLATLAFQSLHAQKRLSPSVWGNAVNWKYSLVKSMHTAGFEMPTLPKSGVVDYQPPATLDSTLSSIHFPGGNPDSVPFIRTTLRYPKENVSIETEYRWEINKWQLFSQTTTVRDDLGRVLEIQFDRYDFDEDAMKPESKLVVHPHEDDPELIDSFFTYLWNPDWMAWQADLKQYNKFNQQDQIQESISIMHNMGDPMTFLERFTYNANGLNTLIEEYRIMGTAEVPSSRTDIQYGEQLLPIEYLVSSMVGQQLLPMTRTNLAYFPNGDLRRQMNFERNQTQQTWRLVQTMNFTYNGIQKLASRELSRNLEEERFYQYYVYNQDGDIYLEMSMHWDDDLFDWVLDGKKYYFYAGMVAVDPQPSLAGALRIMPNPATAVVRLDTQEPLQVRIFNQQGAEVKTLQYEPDQWLELGDLPNGMYVITARSSQGLYTGKMLKQDGQ
jgi:hypothetical protein